MWRDRRIGQRLTLAMVLIRVDLFVQVVNEFWKSSVARLLCIITEPWDGDNGTRVLHRTQKRVRGGRCTYEMTACVLSLLAWFIRSS
jgi:hypothetical protein